MRIPAFALLLVACTPSPAPDREPAEALASATTAPQDAAPAASTTSSSPESTQPTAGPPTSVEPASAQPASAQPASAQPTSVSSAEPAANAAAEVVEAPPLVGEDGELLPQTEAEPKVDSKLFQQRVARLVEAIQKDDPEIARDFFFPRVAYEKVKAIKHPGRDWDARLWKLFVRDVHEYHEKLGDDPPAFVGIEVPMEKSEWMKPHREGNAIGYYRVKRAQLVFRDADGKEKRFEITSMISWRGEWYVVHLHGFK